MRRAVVTVESIAAGGDGVARADGLVVFVPRTAPGDRVEVSLVASGRFARGSVVRLLESAPGRVQPSCVHYERDRCGGCQLQHLDYESQLSAKGTIIRDALQRIGHRTLPVPEVRRSPRQWRYRRKLTLALRRRRSPSDGGMVAGLHPYDAPERVFPLEECPITADPVLEVWHAILASAELLPDAPTLRAAVRVDPDGDASLVVEGGRWDSAASKSEALAARIPALASIWHAPEGELPRPLQLRAGSAALGASFAQVNEEVAADLLAHVVDRAMAYAPRSAVDGYAGVGDTAFALDRRGVRVTAIEWDARAAGAAGARLGPASSAVAGAVEECLTRALPADAIILNPPRAGVDQRVTEALEAAPSRPRAVLYVSCNPATLARDVARLPSYRIASLAAFDMFPQTAHVETVCELVPEG
ncbi:MAG TPA: TRAM domain-containing protein [Gemmatimonadaceae bacterium]|nr:TRAM domain-containing protein [Gemmatimonadaceae bacterium]